jgi:DNA-binding response OmpR family regulator
MVPPWTWLRAARTDRPQAVDAFDAVVLDVMLPDGSGLDLLASLRAKGDRIPVLLLTALDEVSDRIKGLDAGADDYLGKPFDLDELAARVRDQPPAGRTCDIFRIV